MFNLFILFLLMLYLNYSYLGKFLLKINILILYVIVKYYNNLIMVIFLNLMIVMCVLLINLEWGEVI